MDGKRAQAGQVPAEARTVQCQSGLYCECAAGFSHEVGPHDEGYFDALLRMFAQALNTVGTSADDQRPA